MRGAATSRLTFGFPRMHKEPGERRDFRPELLAQIAATGCRVFAESGIGSGMGFTDDDYRRASLLVEVVDARTAYEQDVVVTLRAPDDRLAWMAPGATLVSMLHFPTRPARIRRLAELGLEAISLDSIVDDDGRRLVENLRAVGWNGIEAAFDALACTYPELTDGSREPIRVTVMGAGAIAKHAIEGATKYGNLSRNEMFGEMNLPGVIVTVLGRNVTGSRGAMRAVLGSTDILVDATQRSDASHPIVPNGWIRHLPPHAVICDLVVDPYDLSAHPPTVRGIEGIPQGNLDQWTFGPDDPAWDRTVPVGVPSTERRTLVSCYSWPGIHPSACMRHYQGQLGPLLRTLIERGGVRGLRPDSGTMERALRRASLRSWTEGPEAEPVRPTLVQGTPLVQSV
jgi:alanine dehydrogenase